MENIVTITRKDAADMLDSYTNKTKNKIYFVHIVAIFCLGAFGAVAFTAAVLSFLGLSLLLFPVYIIEYIVKSKKGKNNT